MNRVVPWPVVRGMQARPTPPATLHSAQWWCQLGLGLSMAMKGVAMIDKADQWIGCPTSLLSSPCTL